MLKSAAGRITVTLAIIVIFAAAGLYVVQQYSANKTIYVSSAGSENGNGTSLERAFDSLSKVSNDKLLPGTTIVLSGHNIKGSLSIADKEGKPDKPITVTSPEGERASILVKNDSAAFTINNASNVVIRNVDIVGEDSKLRQGEGIWIASDSAEAENRGITIDDITAKNLKHGVLVKGTAAAGYSDVRISNSRFNNNLLQAILFFNTEENREHLSHKNITIENVHVHGTTGDPSLDTNSGSGIVLGNVDNGTIRDSISEDNGADSSANEGPLGMWTYRSNHIQMYRNISRNNKTRRADGGGFGFDVGVTNSRMEHNYSYGNSGPGYLVFANYGEEASKNIVRFNSSVNDARKGGYHGQISIRGGLNNDGPRSEVSDLLVANNTVIGDETLPSQSISVAGTVDNVRVVRNYFEFMGDGPQLKMTELETPEGVSFCGNAYSSGPNTLSVETRRGEFGTFPSWWETSTTETHSFIYDGEPLGTNSKLVDQAINTRHLISAAEALGLETEEDHNAPSVCSEGYNPNDKDLAGHQVGSMPFIGAIQRAE